MSVGMMLMALTGGFAGSFHCIGMCGGFVCGLSRSATSGKREWLIRNLSYNTGRLTSYCFIGAAVAAASSVVAGNHAQYGAAASVGNLFSAPGTIFQQVLSVLAGLLMLLMALQLLGLRRHSKLSWGRFGGVTFARMLQTLVQSSHPGASLALGVVNGFLPCPLVLSFAAIAAASTHAVDGMLVMFAFGLGTFPAMLFMGGLGGIIPPAVRNRGVRLSGALLMVFALLTIARGVLPMSHHSHPTVAALNAGEFLIAP